MRLLRARSGSSRHPTVVELIGRPGSGKSHVAAAVERESPSIRVLDPFEEVPGRGIVARLWFAMRYPLQSLLLHLAVLSRRGVAMRHVVSVFGLQKRYSLVWSTARGQSRALVDEGFVHGYFVVTWGTRSTGLSRWCLSRLVRRLQNLGVTWALLRVDAAVCETRLEGRAPPSRFAGKGTALDEVYEQLIRELRRAVRQDVHELDERSDAVEAVQALLR